MGIVDILKKAVKGQKPARTGEKQTCPNCGENVNLSMERCPKCGVRIKSMFRRRCPKCKSLNELDIEKCIKCGYNFEAEYKRAKKTYYVCPICRFKMEGMLTRCPACNTRFM